MDPTKQHDRGQASVYLRGADGAGLSGGAGQIRGPQPASERDTADGRPGGCIHDAADGAGSADGAESGRAVPSGLLPALHFSGVALENGTFGHGPADGGPAAKGHGKADAVRAAVIGVWRGGHPSRFGRDLHVPKL